MEDLEVAESKAVHPDKFSLVDTRNRADVPQPIMTGLGQVNEQRTGRTDGQRKGVNGEAFQRPDAQLFAQFFCGRFLGESPLFDRRNIPAVAEFFAYYFLESALDDEFLRRKGREQDTDVFLTSLGHLEGTGRDVQEGRSALVAIESQAGQEVVLFLLQKLVAEGHPRRDQFRHTTLDQFLVFGQFRIFQLVAYGHLVARPDQFGQIALEGMVRETSHLNPALFPIGLPGQNQPQHLANEHGVRCVRFVKIAHTVQQHRFGVLCLYRKELLD